MNQVNFVMINNDKPPAPTPTIARPPCIDDFLALFETHCVVGCCDWDALNLSDTHFADLIESQRSSKDQIKHHIQAVIAWSDTLDGPKVIAGDDWYFDPARAMIELNDALMRLEQVRKSAQEK